MFAAVGSIQRANPLCDFVVFDGRQLLKIPTYNRGQTHRSGIGANFRNGSGQMYDGIVFAGSGSMPRRPASDHCYVHGYFFAGLDRDILHLAVFQNDSSAFVKCEARGKLVPIFGDKDFDAGVAALLLIRRSEKDHIAIDARIAAL